MSYLILTRNWLYIVGSVLLFVLFSSGMAQAARSAAERGVGEIVASGIVQYRASWAVVIGINRHTKAPRLNYAVNDAKSVVAAVQKREAERKEKGGEASKASQAQVIAQLQPPASISRPPVVLPTVAEMPKYKVGDSWTVRFADGQTSPRIVRAIEKDQYVFEWGLDLWRYYDQNLVLIKQVTPEDGKEVRTSLLRQRTMEFPLAANKTWKFRYKLGGGAGGVPSGTGEWREFSFKVLGTEKINTPAGPFGTFKVEETSYEVQCIGSACHTPDSTLTVRHLWYAPEAKFIVKLAGVRGSYISEQEPDYELIAFNLK